MNILDVQVCVICQTCPQTRRVQNRTRTEYVLRIQTGNLNGFISQNIKNIHAYVFGEHGDSSMIPWSLSSIDGMKFDDYCAHIDNLGDKDAIEQEVRAGGAEVIKCKGATYYAIALSVSQIAEAILRDTKMILTVSTLQDGSRYGVKDVCLSLPCVVGANGIEREITPPLLPEEEEAVRKSAAALREVIDAMKAE